MNRRNFIGTVLSAGAGFTILPGAGRIWVPQKSEYYWGLEHYIYNLTQETVNKMELNVLPGWKLEPQPSGNGLIDVYAYKKMSLAPKIPVLYRPQ